MMEMLSSTIISKVTSIKFIGDRILAGISGDLHIYHLISTTHCGPIFRITIFPAQCIYGILNRKKQVLVFGGKALALLDFCRNNDTITKSYIWNTNDWVLNVSWMFNDHNIAIITAHNTVIHFDLQNKVTLHTVNCEERCILYSAKIISTCPDNIILLAGTVFQEIVIWTSPNLRSASNSQPVLHRLKGHKGVIFYVDYQAKSRLICSTSDDRTVRVWFVALSDTCYSMKDKWKNAKITLKHTIFGHTARVWRSCFLSNDRIVSVGEDSFVCIWDKCGNCVKQWSGHQGGIIWAVDCSEELGLIITGGNDSGISLWPLSDVEHPALLKNNSLHDREPVTPKLLSITFNGTVIMITECGSISVYGNERWKLCYRDKRILSYCVGNLSASRRMFALGSIKGDILIFSVHDGELIKIVEFSGVGKKIFSILWVSETEIITCEDEGLVLLWRLKEFQGQMNLQIEGKFVLPSSKERWITSALLHLNYLICGDRMGSVHLYIIQEDGDATVPIHSLIKLHGTRGVSCLQSENDNIISTGRDGTVRRLAISNFSLQIISTNKLPMDWTAYVQNTKIFGPIVTGFHNVHFVVWSIIEQRYLLKIDCGGGHRSWDYMIDENSSYLSLIFIKNKEVYYFHNPLSKIYCRPPLIGYHTKTINAGYILPTSNCDEIILLTGSEDTTLRTSRISRNMVFKPDTIIRNHISSIRTICSVSSIYNNTTYVFSAGGRGQIKAWKFFSIDNGNSSLVELASHMVRNESHRHWLKARPLPDPETRYMDLTAVEMNSPSILIIAGCSDGLLRFLEFDFLTSKLNISNILEFHQHCILKVFHFKINGCVIAASLATDGKAAFWNAGKNISKQLSDSPVKPIEHYKIHDSGINSCAFQCQSDYLILATGSDDTTVNVNVFKFDENKSSGILASWSSKHLHYCQVTGAFMTNKYILTVGLDKQMNILTWTYKNCFLNVQSIYSFKSCISDIHGLQIWYPSNQMDELNICIFGGGVQLVSINENQELLKKNYELNKGGSELFLQEI